MMLPLVLTTIGWTPLLCSTMGWVPMLCSSSALIATSGVHLDCMFESRRCYNLQRRCLNSEISPGCYCCCCGGKSKACLLPAQQVVLLLIIGNLWHRGLIDFSLLLLLPLPPTLLQLPFSGFIVKGKSFRSILAVSHSFLHHFPPVTTALHPCSAAGAQALTPGCPARTSLLIQPLPFHSPPPPFPLFIISPTLQVRGQVHRLIDVICRKHTDCKVLPRPPSPPHLLTS